MSMLIKDVYFYLSVLLENVSADEGIIDDY
jgi:hypothetical protein